MGSRTERQRPVHGEAHTQPSLQMHSLKKCMWNLKIQVLQCPWVRLIPFSKAVSFLFFYLRKGVAAGMCVVFGLLVCSLWSSPGSSLTRLLCSWMMQGSRTLSPLETLEARVDRYIKCQWSAKRDGHRDAYYLLALWKCKSLFRLRGWPRGLIALSPTSL